MINLFLCYPANYISQVHALVMDIKYTWILLQGENGCWIASMNITYWSVHSSSGRGEGKGGVYGYRYFSQL